MTVPFLLLGFQSFGGAYHNQSDARQANQGSNPLPNFVVTGSTTNKATQPHQNLAQIIGIANNGKETRPNTFIGMISLEQ